MTQVLIVGAGPTGLTAALWLTRLGVPFRIVERNPGPGLASRAMAVAARTLEFYRQLGLADQVVAAGIQMRRFHVREDGKPVATLELGEFGQGKSPYPFVLSYPQDEHEKFLGAQLRAAGVEIEWKTQLVSFTQDSGGVRAVLRRDDGDETVEAAYVIGCDGAQSRVRKQLGLQFAGAAYDQPFFVADVALVEEQPTEDVRVNLGPNSLLLVFPIRSTGNYRLIGIIPEDLWGGEVTFEQLRPTFKQLIDLEIAKVNWFSTYKVHHRVAEKFCSGRAFIAGDAGHVHSPAGGQGMNTGIGDAVNLAWKLAAVLQRRASPSILESYEIERLAFAQSLVATTDRGFKAVIGNNFLGRAVRTFLVPHIMPLAFDVGIVRHFMFDLISQIRIEYHDSPLSQGRYGHILGGDRLPWVEDLDNFAPLRSLDWQIHVYGSAGEAAKLLPVHEFPFTERAREVGFEEDALYVVRPDGYVALACGPHDRSALVDYLRNFEVTART